MKKSLMLATIASLSLMMSCGTTEIVNPTLSSEVGSGTVSGKFRVDLNETNFNTGNTIYETFPENTAVLEVSYNESDVNPTNFSNSDISKVMQVRIAADGTYSFTVPASGKGTSITVKPLDFVATRVTTGETKQYIFVSSQFSLTVKKGSTYPQSIKTYSASNAAE